MHEITLRKRFSAAHNLREYRGKCERLHGHNYRVDIVLCSDRLNATGMVMDFQEVKRLAALVTDKLDHAYLNEVAPFDDLNPTAENIACHIADEMAARLPDGVSVKSVTCWESEDCGATCVPEPGRRRKGKSR